MGIDWNVVFFVNFLLLYPNRRPHFEMNFFLSFSSCIFFFILLWNVWSALTQLCHRPSGCQWINSSLLPLLQYGRTPLHLAANNGSLEVVRHLCLAGANTEAVTHVSHRAAYCLLFLFYFLTHFTPRHHSFLSLGGCWWIEGQSFWVQWSPMKSGFFSYGFHMMDFSCSQWSKTRFNSESLLRKVVLTIMGHSWCGIHV